MRGEKRKDALHDERTAEPELAGGLGADGCVFPVVVDEARFHVGHEIADGPGFRNGEFSGEEVRRLSESTSAPQAKGKEKSQKE